MRSVVTLAEEVAEISRFGDFVWNYFLGAGGQGNSCDLRRRNCGLEVDLPGDTMMLEGTNHAAGWLQ